MTSDRMTMRLNRYLAGAGCGSRRSCEELIRSGRVALNGQVCTSLATTVAPRDAVKVNGKLVHLRETMTLMLNKPRGYICASSDQRGERTIFELLPKRFSHLFHVGRLDKDSEGLLIVTNDGDLSLRLTHPRYKVEKEYEVTLDRRLESADRVRMLHGVHIEGGRARAERVSRLSATKWRTILRQGMKRQIRLMFGALGYEVRQLRRVRVGPLPIGRLHEGEWRLLSRDEIQSLRTSSSGS